MLPTDSPRGSGIQVHVHADPALGQPRGPACAAHSPRLQQSEPGSAEDPAQPPMQARSPLRFQCSLSSANARTCVKSPEILQWGLTPKNVPICSLGVSLRRQGSIHPPPHGGEGETEAQTLRLVLKAQRNLGQLWTQSLLQGSFQPTYRLLPAHRSPAPWMLHEDHKAREPGTTPALSLGLWDLGESPSSLTSVVDENCSDRDEMVAGPKSTTGCWGHRQCLGGVPRGALGAPGGGVKWVLVTFTDPVNAMRGPGQREVPSSLAPCPAVDPRGTEAPFRDSDTRALGRSVGFGIHGALIILRCSRTEKGPYSLQTSSDPTFRAKGSPPESTILSSPVRPQEFLGMHCSF